MKVALVVPNSRVKLNSDCSPPLGLAYIASYLRETISNVEVKIFDGATGVNVEHAIFMFQPDVVGITATTPQAPDAFALASILKRNRPSIIVVLGGPHVSALPKKALAYADYVVVGEGETAFAKLIEENPNRGVIQGQPVLDLDSLSFPAYDLLDMNFYLSRRFIAQVLPPPILGLVFGRGCPFRCRFCYNSNRISPVRYFSAKRVAKELTFLHTKYGVSNFFFQDDEFLINLGRLKELADIFKAGGIDKWIKWGCQARVTSITKEVLDLAESIGCKLIVPGIESYNPRMLEYLKKGSVKIADIDRALELFKNSKIMLGANVIVGSPTETLAEMQQTFQLYLDHPEITFMNLNCLTPYPGTEVWADCVKAGLFSEDIDYSKLLPTDELQNTLNFSTLPTEEFVSFLTDCQRIKYVVQNIRFGANFFGLARKRVWWWMWFKHPKIMLKLLYTFLRGWGR